MEAKDAEIIIHPAPYQTTRWISAEFKLEFLVFHIFQIDIRQSEQTALDRALNFQVSLLLSGASVISLKAWNRHFHPFPNDYP